MAAKFKLIPDPTFKADVDLPVPGEKNPVPVGFTFKYRDADAYEAMWKKFNEEKIADVPMLQEIATAWQLEEPFDADHLEIFTKKHPKAAGIVLAKYCQEVGPARLGN